MLKFQLQKRELFECELSIDGIDYEKLTPRLVLIPEIVGGKKFQFEGTFKDSKCYVPVFLDEHPTKNGIAILEVTIDDSEYIEPWKSTYEVYSLSSVVKTEARTSSMVKKSIVENKQPTNEITIPDVSKSEIRRIIDAIDEIKNREKTKAKQENIDEELLSKVDAILAKLH